LVREYTAIIASPLDDLIFSAPKVIKLALEFLKSLSSSLASVVYTDLAVIWSPSNVYMLFFIHLMYILYNL